MEILSAYHRFLTWSVDYCTFYKLNRTSVHHPDPNVRNCEHITYWPIITATSYRHARHEGISSQETTETPVYRLESNNVANRKVADKKTQTRPYQSFVHSECVLLPFMHHMRHVPTTFTVPPPLTRIPESSPGQTVPCLYRSILIHSTLR